MASNVVHRTKHYKVTVYRGKNPHTDPQTGTQFRYNILNRVTGVIEDRSQYHWQAIFRARDLETYCEKLAAELAGQVGDTEPQEAAEVAEA